MSARALSAYRAARSIGCTLVSSSMLLLAASAIASAQKEPCKLDLDPATLEAGDLIFPRTPVALVPYGSKEEAVDRAAWEGQRDAFLRRIAAASPTPEQSESALRLRYMTYPRFKAVYMEGAGSQPTGFGGSSRVVGHVVIADIADDKSIHIIEVLWQGGVLRKPFAEWVRSVCGFHLWHGRMKRPAAAVRRRIAEVARQHVGKPYDFFNWQLDDEKAFYCSKLAWLAIYRATGIAPDGNTTAKRNFWYSPRQLLESAELSLLKNPGAFSRPFLTPQKSVPEKR